MASANRATDDLTANRRVRMTAGISIDYDALTQEALRGVVRKILYQVVAKGGLPGEHHFYIAFNTQAPDVVMSRRLKEKYPEEMMIVLQHRFWDLAVTDIGFEVKLTFDGIPERLYVPFEALRVFFDPSVRFTLQFGEPGAADDGHEGNGRRRRDGGERRQPPEWRSQRPDAGIAITCRQYRRAGHSTHHPNTPTHPAPCRVRARRIRAPARRRAKYVRLDGWRPRTS